MTSVRHLSFTGFNGLAMDLVGPASKVPYTFCSVGNFVFSLTEGLTYDTKQCDMTNESLAADPTRIERLYCSYLLVVGLHKTSKLIHKLSTGCAWGMKPPRRVEGAASSNDCTIGILRGTLRDGCDNLASRRVYHTRCILRLVLPNRREGLVLDSPIGRPV